MNLWLKAAPLVVLCVALCVPGALSAAEAPSDGWEKVGDSRAISLWRREVPGSPIIAIKGAGPVDAPPWKVALVLLDCARAPEWVDSLDESRVVEVRSPVEHVEYNHVAMPFPVRNREFLTLVRLEHDEASRVATIRSQSTELANFPVRAMTLRASLRASYRIEPRDGGRQSYLTVEMHSDPQGGIPSWLVNFFQTDWGKQSIEGIRRQVKKGDLAAPRSVAAWLEKVAGGPLGLESARQARSR
jgi:hypothetical protein